MPYAGGGAAAWYPWATHLGPVAELVAIRLPARESRLTESPVTDLLTLSRELATAIAPHTNEPYALGGHSLGALLAFEVTRELRRRGSPLPVALIASGARAPDCPRNEPDLHHLPDDDFIREVDQRYQGIPPALLANREFLDLFLPVLRGDLKAFESYHHHSESPLNLPLLSLWGDRDPRVSMAEALAWRAHTTSAFESKTFSAGHFFLPDQIEMVTKEMRDFLARAAA
ncbi:alpha/beta fold hydrolase [Opitutaceae bacterium]|nr:alpha/beta fold hydrolase [Opitutaceae bacterium]